MTLIDIPNLGIGAGGLTLAAVTPNDAGQIVIAVVTTVMQLIHLFKRKNKKQKNETPQS